jgi:uncharacterized protein (TIGR03118 family)
MKQIGWRVSVILLLSIAIVPLGAQAQHYVQTNLVSDVPGLAAHTDPDLVNAWGIARSATSPWWVNDNGTGKSTLYNQTGTKLSLVVTIPPPPGSTDPSTPTGMVFNGGTGFVVTGTSGGSGPARFIFATEDGTISGWNPAADPTNAILEVNNSSSAIYKGLAIGTFTGATLLYAANFAEGRVDVFDSTWHATTVPGGFVDTALPAGYAPFNVQNLGGKIFVSFAQQGTMPDENDGKGLGYVDAFDTGGNLLMRFEHGPWLNAPWGMAIAPPNFGEFSNRLLVGQFGSGQIAAYDLDSGEFEGLLHGSKGALSIDGLWALAFGGGSANNGPTNTLFFTAGINDEQDGLFGTLTVAPDNDENEIENENDEAPEF